MISVDFDRAKMRRRLTAYSAALLVSMLFICGSWTLLHLVGVEWIRRIVLVTIYAVCVLLIEVMVWVGLLGRDLRRKGPAVVINETGVVDNASRFGLGQLAWNEIETMYPWDWNLWLIAKRWRVPGINNQRGIVVKLKDGVDLQRLLLGKSSLVRLMMRQWYISGRKRWVFIPEMSISVSADELVRQINRFYVAEVRGAG